MPFSAALLLIAQAGTLPVASPPSLKPPACDTAAHGQFDCWAGDWDVYPNSTDQTKTPLVARSKIEKL